MIFVTAVPGAPDKPTVSSVTRNSMTVNWEEPEYDGGSPVTGYWLEMKDTTTKRFFLTVLEIKKYKNNIS